MTDPLHLPTGSHWGLHIEHKLITTGSFVGGGHKMVWHTTEGSGIDGGDSTVRANGDQPHFMLDTHTGRCIQYVALNQFSKALKHAPGTKDTNRANAIQVELVGFASKTTDWSYAQLRKVAALACLVDHRFNVPRKAPVPFIVGKRMGPDSFYNAEGHFGHMHVPGNDHEDPGHLNIGRVFTFMRELEKNGGKV